MEKVVYVGPHDAVEVPALGLTVKRNEPVEVPKDEAASLLAQDTWAKPRTTKKEIED